MNSKEIKILFVYELNIFDQTLMQHNLFKMIFPKKFLYLLFIQYTDCDCGPAGKPFGILMYGFRSFSPEKSSLHYECEENIKKYTALDTTIFSRLKSNNF